MHILLQAHHDVVSIETGIITQASCHNNYCRNFHHQISLKRSGFQFWREEEEGETQSLVSTALLGRGDSKLHAIMTIRDNKLLTKMGVAMQ